MKQSLENKLRHAFRAGRAKGLHGDNYFDAPLDEDEYIESLKEVVVEEDKISFTYDFLRRKIDWEQFCDLTGVDYYALNKGFEIKNSEIFYITESQAKKYNLL